MTSSNLQATPLGQLLVDTGAISRAALDEVLGAQRGDRRKLGELLVERGLVRPHQLAQILSHQLSCPWISLPRIAIAADVLALISPEIAFEHRVIPVHVRTVGKIDPKKTLYVAIADPTDQDALDECERASGITVKPMVAIESELRAALREHYIVPANHVQTAPPPPLVEEVDIDDADVEVVVPAELRRATILTLNAPEAFLSKVRGAIEEAAAEVVDGNLMRAADLVVQHKPCAIVVTDDVYAFDRTGLNRLALDNDTVLVVWSEDADSKQLAPLLLGALKRWRHAAYEKGAILDGRYELLRDLGGPVADSRWEVRHARTSRRAILHVAVANDEAAGVGRQQIALARVSHPGAVDLLDAGMTENGDPYIVLEPLEGKTLEGLVVARGKLSLLEACGTITQLVAIVEAAHEACVVHNAITSESVVFVRDAWGVERARLGNWEAAEVRDDNLDPSVDVSALGRCAFEALGGRKPSKDDTLGNDIPSDLAAAVTEAIRGSLPLAQLAEAASKAIPRRERKATKEEAAPEAAPEPKPPAAEHRRFPRAPYRTPVRIEVAGFGNVDGRSEDISARGIYVVSRAKIAENTEVKVRFALPLDGKVVAETAIVKWTRDAKSAEGAGLTAIGVELVAPSVEALRQIEKYVALMSSES